MIRHHGVAKLEDADGFRSVQSDGAVGGDVDGAEIRRVAAAAGNDAAQPVVAAGPAPVAAGIGVPGAALGLQAGGACQQEQADDGNIFFIFMSFWCWFFR